MHSSGNEKEGFYLGFENTRGSRLKTKLVWGQKARKMKGVGVDR